MGTGYIQNATNPKSQINNMHTINHTPVNLNVCLAVHVESVIALYKKTIKELTVLSVKNGYMSNVTNSTQKNIGHTKLMKLLTLTASNV